MTRLPPQTDPPLSPRQTLPTMYDLPSENPEEPGLPDTFHLDQSQLLDITFQPSNWESDRVFSATDLNLYYNVDRPNWYKRPDWFGVVGVPRLYEERDMRLSYVIWQERVSPFVVVELLSPGTEAEDLGETVSQPGTPPTKWEVYEQILRVPYYIVFSHYTNQVQAFRLTGGRYESIAFETTTRESSLQGRLPIPGLGLSLGLWRGSYKGIDRLWLRWLTPQGELIPTPNEQAATAEERAKAAEQRAERLAAKLRELGINPEELD